VDNIINECHADLSLDKSNIYRLGKYDATKHTKRLRPLRLSTKSESQMWDLLIKIIGLKMPGVFARKDLTKKKQGENFQLRKELKKRRNVDPNSKYKIKMGKIVKVTN